ncbi:hypothetical protein ElyMa_002491200 [Elysia marginata]|uniref:Uncharacterized protein n=1 Tax=Elysia marginata TaxID=1093978 RepID=A0AAV4GPZ7_9GAST|nr:hypothetical protein ElyMa_002491200 [Elysia marginata]
MQTSESLLIAPPAPPRETRTDKRWARDTSRLGTFSCCEVRGGGGKDARSVRLERGHMICHDMTSLWRMRNKFTSTDASLKRGVCVCGGGGATASFGETGD